MNVQTSSVTLLDQIIKGSIFRFNVREALSTPFSMEIELHTPQEIPMHDVLMKECSFSITNQPEPKNKAQTRFFSGLISHIEHLQTIETNPLQHRFFIYKICLRPKLWFLNFEHDCRIFQEQSTLDILFTIFKDHNIVHVSDLTVKNGREQRTYCVQYNESCFDFVSRLMEEEGIFYFFTYDMKGHTLVLADSNTAINSDIGILPLCMGHTPFPLFASITHMKNRHSAVTQSCSLSDYNPEIASTRLLSSTSGIGQFGEHFKDHGRFSKRSIGDTYAQILMESHEINALLIDGESTSINLSPGCVFTLVHHPIKTLNDLFYVHSVTHTFLDKTPSPRERDRDPSLKNPVYSNTFKAFNAKKPFRPPLKTPKPIIASHQTALVTGPSGEEVYCDDQSRIKISFYWDRKGPKNEKSSCWIRVAQNWAGSNYGGLVIPRIGMEVVVSFLNGDPDRPLVIGCVYNSDQIPPNNYPKQSPTKSTFKTQSSKKDKGFNELRFEDQKGSEEIFIHAQKDMNTVIEDARTYLIIKGSDTKTVEKKDILCYQKGATTKHLLSIQDGDDILQIQKGNQSITLSQGNQSVTLSQGNQSVTLSQGNQTTTLSQGNCSLTLSSGNLSINITGNITLKGTGNISIEAGQNISIKSGMNTSLEAGMNLQSKSGMNTQMQAGMNIQMQAGMALQAKAGMQASLEAGLSLDLKAGLSVALSAGLMLDMKAGLQSNITAGLCARHFGGVTALNQGGVTGITQGSAGALLKGIITIPA